MHFFRFSFTAIPCGVPARELYTFLIPWLIHHRNINNDVDDDDDDNEHVYMK